MKKLLTMICCVAMIAAVGKASAVVLTFDDLAPYEGSGEPIKKIPNNYGGFSWSDLFYYTNPDDLHEYYNVAESGFANGLVSGGENGNHVAYNDSAAVVSIAGGIFDSFTFNNVWLTAAWRNHLNIRVDGYRDGVLRYWRVVEVNWSESKQFVFNWNDVDTLVFNSYGGEMVDDDNDGVPDLGFDYTHFVMDDFAYNEPEAHYDGSPELSARCKAFVSRKFGKLISVKLNVANTGTAKADEFDVAMFLSNDGFYPDVLLDEKRVRHGLRQNRTRNITLTYSSENSLSGRYLYFVIDSDYVVPEANKLDNVTVLQAP